MSRCFTCVPWNDEVDGYPISGEGEEDALYVELKCGHFFEYEGMDHYLKTQTSFDENGINISYPSCPRCKALIVCTPSVKRYKPLLNRARKIVNTVKAKAQLVDQATMELLEKAEAQLKDMVAAAGKTISKESADPFRNVPVLREAIKDAQARRERIRSAGKNLQLTNSLCHRIFLLNLVFSITAKIPNAAYTTSDGKQADAIMNAGIKCLLELVGNAENKEMDAILSKTFSDVLLSKNIRPSQSTDYNKLAQMIGDSRGLSDDEKKEIHKALVAGGQIQRSGAYKMCSCGYIYVVGDCGGAMTTTQCPSCHRTIGGGQHRDAQGVRHTGEFDGSSAPAWPQ